MHDPHHDDRGNRDRRVVVEDVVDDVFEPEHARGHHVVAPERRRNDRGGRGDDARSRHRAHLRRAKDGVEGRHEDDRKRRGARNNDREDRTDPENERHENVGRTHRGERTREHFDHFVVRTDVRHVGRKAEERQNDETRVRVLLHEEVLHDLEGVDPRQTRTRLFGKHRMAERERGEKENEAGGKEHHLGVVVLRNGPAGHHESHEGEDHFQHVCLIGGLAAAPSLGKREML